MTNRGPTTPHPTWLTKLHDMYNPTQRIFRTGVVMLRGQVNDSFYYDYRMPEANLVECIVEHYWDAVDVLVWYKPGIGLIYEKGRGPGLDTRATAESSTPSAGRSELDSLRRSVHHQRSQAQPQTPVTGSMPRVGPHAEAPFSAIREINALFRDRANRNVLAIIQGNNIWDLWNDRDPLVMTLVDDWPRELPRHGHLAVFASPEFSAQTAAFLRALGVLELAHEQMPADAIRRWLLIDSVLAKRPLVGDYAQLDKTVQRLHGAYATLGYDQFIRDMLAFREKRTEPSTQTFEMWVDRLQKAAAVGQQAEKKQLDDLILNPADAAYVRDVILPSIRDPEGYRTQKASNRRRSPERVRLPRKFLFQGPPGTGKTSLAKAIATESDLIFFSLKAADLTSIYRGGPVKAVKEAFAHWKKNRPCIAFLDEVESIARSRGPEQHEDAPITQLLAELEPAEGWDDGIVFIAATNRPELLDTAFLQRMLRGRVFTIGLPDQERRERLVEMYFDLGRGVFEPGLTASEIAQLLENQAPRAIESCAEAMDELLDLGYELISAEMIAEWVSQNPVNMEEVRRWQALSAKQEQEYKRLAGIAG